MDMYDILKKLNSVGSTPLYESAVPRAAEVDKSRIPAYKRKDSGEEKLTLKDLEAERSKSATGAAGLKKLKDRTGVEEGIEQMVSSGHKIISNRKTPKGEFIVLQNKNDGKYEIHKFVGPASTTGYEFISAYKTPQEMQSAFKSLTGVAEGESNRAMNEQGVEEGNEYVNARRAAIRAGRPTFTVGGKTHKVTGDTSQEKAGVEESAEETPRGRIHRAAPGGYGRKYDQDDEEGGEKKPAAPKIDRGRGRPKKEREPFSGDEASKLQSYVVGNKPKSGLPGKAGVKHTKMADQEKAEKARERASAKDELDELSPQALGNYRTAALAQANKSGGIAKGLDRSASGATEKESDRFRYSNRTDPNLKYQGGGDAYAKQSQKRFAGAKQALAKGAVQNEGEDEFDPANRGEYDREGEMAQDQLKTAADAANELRSILDSDENLPEWIQSKITMAMDYLDTARDNMKSREDDEEPVKEAGNYSAKRARAGADIGKPGKNFAKIEKSAGGGEKGKKIAGAVLNKLRHPKEEVEETTTAGSVATAPAAGGKKTKGGVQFGKGVYEGALAESFSSKLKTMLNEEISMNLTTNSNGTKSLTVTATDDDAMRLAEILKLAGMESQAPAGDTAEACGACGQSPCGCDHIDEDDHANSPDPMYADTDTMVNKLSGGLNGPKEQVNPNNLADNPMAMKRLGVKQSPQVNLGSADIGESNEKRLWTIYNRQDTK